jgi:hypothetical protein
VAKLPDGKLLVSVFQTDVAGNLSEVRTKLVAKDTVPLPAPVILPVTGDDIVTPTERRRGLNIEGRAAGTQPVTVSVGSLTKSATRADRTWSVRLSAAESTRLPAGAVVVKATVTDAAGNPSHTTRTFQNN